MRPLAAVLVVVAAAGACTPATGDRGKIDVSIQLATRQSCGLLSGLDYDTGCATAVDVRVLDAVTRNLVSEQCRVLDTQAPTLGALLEGGTPLVQVSKLSTTGTVIFQVRALHDLKDGVDGGPPTNVDPSTLCAHAAEKDQWLFWGDSEPFDLGALDHDPKASRIVRIVLDCRDCTYGTQTQCGGTQCFGCGGVGRGTCPASLPTSFCVPTVACDKACDNDAECFDGALQCIGHVCTASVPTGELCSPCGSAHGDLGCADGFDCVKRGSTGDGFCADVCPGNDHVCAAGTKCTRIGNDVQLSN